MKTLLSLFKRDGKALATGVYLGILSGLVSFAFLTFFNFMIAEILGNQYPVINFTYVVLFFLIIVLFIWSRRTLSFHIIKYSQHLFWKLRVEVLMMILRSDYSQLEQQRNRIHTALVSDIGALTQASLSIINFITSIVITLSCLIYMITLSMPLFLLTLVTCVAGIVIYQLGSRQNNRSFETSRNIEDGFMSNFRAMLSGVKEIHLNPLKGHSILDRNIVPLSKRAYGTNTEAFVGFLNNQITGQILFYMLISAILLVFSVILDVEKMVVVNFLFILLYLLGSVETIMILLPGLVRGKVSINRLNELKRDLEKQEFVNNISEKKIKKGQFSSLKVEGLEFRYDGENEEECFVIGPINISINAGELIFIYGGNGSGKTTFIQSLLGLLRYTNGSIYFNGEELNRDNYADYKTMYSAVFNDYYLFDQFYGNESFDKEKAAHYLQLFEIEGKVEVVETGFSSIDLSTGQRKRLALVATLLENRPIIVLDEWAADQDPYFRKKFYQEILPQLKDEGFTIIAITHDDSYYHCCDKLYHMQYGKLVDLSKENNLKTVSKIEQEHE